jgi:hypothetical protein
MIAAPELGERHHLILVYINKYMCNYVEYIYTNICTYACTHVRMYVCTYVCMIMYDCV